LSSFRTSVTTAGEAVSAFGTDLGAACMGTDEAHKA